MPSAVVIGGGVMGLAMARELRRRALDVVLVERSQPGRAASWASAGIVDPSSGHAGGPAEGLRRASRQRWPGFAAELAAESGLDPEYRETGCLQPALDEQELAELGRALEAGLVEGGRLVQGAELREAEPVLGPAVRGALLLPGGNVENRRLCRALEIAARRGGVQLRAGAEVRRVAAAGGRVAGVELADARLPADLVVVAAGAWSGALPGCQPAPPVVPQRGQILALDRADVNLRHVVLKRDDPYLVPRCDGRIVVGATRELAGWDASLTAGGVAWLLAAAMQLVPALAACPIHELWTGFRPLSADGLPIIGPGAADGLYFLTGHGPSGIAPLPGSVALLAALVFGEPPPVPPEPFSPLRFAREPAVAAAPG